MSEAPGSKAPTTGPDTVTATEYSSAGVQTVFGGSIGNDVISGTAGADQPSLFGASPDVHPTVARVVNAVQATTPPADWATTAATLLQALQPEISMASQLSRASPKTQATIVLAEMAIPTLAAILQMFFRHPKA